MPLLTAAAIEASALTTPIAADVATPLVISATNISALISSLVSAAGITTAAAIVQGLRLVHALVPLLGAAAVKPGTLLLPVGAVTAVLNLSHA